MMRILIIAGAGTAIGSPTWLWAQQTSGTGATGYIHGPHMMWDVGWYGMILGPIFMILLLAVLIAAIVLIVRWAGGPSVEASLHHILPERTALDVLEERYARGGEPQQQQQRRGEHKHTFAPSRVPLASQIAIGLQLPNLTWLKAFRC